MLRDAGKDTEGKQTALFSYFSSFCWGPARTIPRCAGSTRRLLRQVRRHVEDSDKVLKSQALKFDDIFAAMERIITGDEAD